MLNKVNHCQIRKYNGYQIAEFSAALVLLVFGIVFPLLNLSVLPLHWILSQEIITSETRRLAGSESFSNAISTIANDSILSTNLEKVAGVKPVSLNCAMLISMLRPPYETILITEPHHIKTEWLPGGRRSPCTYQIETSAVIELRPLILLDGINTPVAGITRPFKCTIQARSNWENYGRNPITKEFFINE